MKTNEIYVGIHFDDVSVCLNYLNTLQIQVSEPCIGYIKKMHDAVFFVNQDMPIKILTDVCSRCANKILKRIEHDLLKEKCIVVKLKRYSKSDYFI